METDYTQIETLTCNVVNVIHYSGQRIHQIGLGLLDWTQHGHHNIQQ